MNSPISRLALLALAATTASLSAQTTLSDFTGPDVDSWTGSINGTTTFPNGFTAATAVNEAGNDVLNLSDGGFGGGAVRTYSGLPTTGFVTISARCRIVTDPGTLNPDPNSNPGTFGTAFGVAAGSAGLDDQAFGYGKSLSTTADDSGQSFVTYAATVRADGSGDFTALFIPDQQEGAVGSGTWVAQIDDVTLEPQSTNVTVLSDFAAGDDGWASITPTNAPFGSGFTTVTASGGELALTDGGFTGGALNTYVGAATSAGIHNVLVDVRIDTDSGTLDRARIAAVAGGPTTDYSELAFSQAFSTINDDSGQAYQTVAVPVITTGPSDITVYVLTDYDASIGGGAWDIRIDNVRVASPSSTVAASFTTQGTGCPSPVGVSTLSAPQLPVLGGTLEVVMNNVSPTGLPLMIIGFTTVPAFPISVIGLTSDASCLLTVNLDALEGPIVPSGTVASLLLPLPGVPALAGTPLFFQGTQLELTTSDWNLTDEGTAILGF